MKRTDERYSRFVRLANRVEKAMLLAIIFFSLLLIASQFLLGCVPSVRAWLVRTDRLEGTIQLPSDLRLK